METENSNNDQWAIVETMGNIRTAGKISQPLEGGGGLLRVDVPLPPDGNFRTEYYGMAAIYSVKLVSKEIAIVYADAPVEAREYNAPIVTRAQYQDMQEKAKNKLRQAYSQIAELKRILTSINALPEPKEENLTYWKERAAEAEAMLEDGEPSPDKYHPATEMQF